MAYKITFSKKDRSPIYAWEENEKQIPLWRKGDILDKIIIKPTGRCVYSKPFRENIIYRLFDYSLPRTERKSPVDVVIIYKDSAATEIAILPNGTIRTPAAEVAAAIIAADKQYCKAGGGIIPGRNMLHKDKVLQEALLECLTQR